MPFIDLWETQLIKEGKSKNTIYSYLSDVTKYIKWFEDTYDGSFDNKVLDMDIKSYQSYLFSIRKQSVNTVIRNVVSIKRFNVFLIHQGVGEELSSINEIIVKKADGQDVNIKILENNALHKLRRAFYKVGNKRDILIFEILLNTGIRVTELVNLELKDINMTERNGSNRYSFIRIRQGKGGIYREVPLNGTCRKAIKDYLEIRNISDTDKLHIGERGPLQRFSINKILAKYCDIAQVDEISPHTLRHTFATRLLKELKVDIVTISKLLGHSNILVTERYYINNSREDKIKAVNLLEL